MKEGTVLILHCTESACNAAFQLFSDDVFHAPGFIANGMEAIPKPAFLRNGLRFIIDYCEMSLCIQNYTSKKTCKLSMCDLNRLDTGEEIRTNHELLRINSR